MELFSNEDELLKEANGMKFKGRPVEEFDEQQLRLLVGWMAKEMQRMRERYSDTMGMMSSLHQARLERQDNC